MTALERILLFVGIALELAALAGLVVRRRLMLAYAFGGYLTAVLVTDALTALWTKTFLQWKFWVLKELAINLFMLAVAMELTYRTFRAFPGAWSTARRAYVVVAMATLGVVIWTPTQGVDAPVPMYAELVSKVYPRLLSGAIWLFTGIAFLILWYRIPIEWFHKTILVGFVPYLLVFTVGLNLLDTYGWHVSSKVSYLSSCAFIVVLAYWVYACWHPAREPAQPPPPMTAVERPT
jgi:hypothetical protein